MEIATITGRTRVVEVPLKVDGKDEVLKVTRRYVPLTEAVEVRRDIARYNKALLEAEAIEQQPEITESPIVALLLSIVLDIGLTEGGRPLAMTKENLVRLDNDILSHILDTVLEDVSPDFSKPASHSATTT